MALALPRGNKQQQRDRSPVGGRLLVRLLLLPFLLLLLIHLSQVFGGGDGGRRFKDVYLLDAQRLMANVPASSSLRAYVTLCCVCCVDRCVDRCSNSGSPRVSAKERRKRRYVAQRRCRDCVVSVLGVV